MVRGQVIEGADGYLENLLQADCRVGGEVKLQNVHLRGGAPSLLVIAAAGCSWVLLLGGSTRASGGWHFFYQELVLGPMLRQEPVTRAGAGGNGLLVTSYARVEAEGCRRAIRALHLMSWQSRVTHAASLESMCPCLHVGMCVPTCVCTPRHSMEPLNQLTTLCDRQF